MDTLHIYNKLLQFALFQGLSKADLGALVTHTRLGFHKYAEGDTIARAQTTCDRLFFLIDGRVEVVTSADNGSYAVAETAAAPLLFEPEALFGVSPHYASLYRALTPCSVIGIGKDEIYKLIDLFLSSVSTTSIFSLRLSRSDTPAVGAATAKASTAASSTLSIATAATP